jgi:hypothetical protein
MNNIKTFFNGEYYQGGMSLKEIDTYKRIYCEFATSVLNSSDADHVVYFHSIYKDDGQIDVVRFYSGLQFSDEEFEKMLNGLTGDYYLGAVHRK